MLKTISNSTFNSFLFFEIRYIKFVHFVKAYKAKNNDICFLVGKYYSNHSFPAKFQVVLFSCRSGQTRILDETVCSLVHTDTTPQGPYKIEYQKLP